ncbi:hypothetical protein TTHERM_000227279 (macronuclear) [Tetrahymena thermophila SB210]|uniref:Uncharacterized protein n=1 Tax=Tetrahymena thermophila (strain SB210) TaxID=312017 RepID=W7X5U9_TETTS|nr:hypothetical protein TTHERM_000227279 [Tetrahymena thermophila SB210]EWS74740.1 hypothetical protein TTHERM_000227279 [Tetrahymena thermophila SB210]|eukprot:XP_012652741.1 hypothetical protein TTHERM_000227279 [Tetrahymena thermophila SB210]
MIIINKNCNNQIVQRMPQKRRRLHLQATIGQDNNNKNAQQMNYLTYFKCSHLLHFLYQSLSQFCNIQIFKINHKLINTIHPYIFSKYFYSNSPNPTKQNKKYIHILILPKKYITQATTSIYLQIFIKQQR